MIKPINQPQADPARAAGALKQRSGKTPVSEVSEAPAVGIEGDRASLAARDAAGTGPSFDAGRVQKLRDQIASGQYQVSARATARGLLRQTRDLQGL